MRVSDVFRMKWTDIQNGRLHYAMGKYNKVGSLKVPDKAARIISQYEQFKENKEDLIFPDLKGCELSDKFITQRTIAFKTSAIDKMLRLHVAPAAKIEKKLTMHIARHSFARMLHISTCALCRCFSGIQSCITFGCWMKLFDRNY